jgi:hypothetical protein
MLMNDIKIWIIIIISSAFQSIAGVGVLVLGTPLLLALNKDYIDILNTLIPCALTISISQLIFNFKYGIDYNFVKGLKYSVPILVFCLLISINFGNFIFLVVGTILVMISRIKEKKYLNNKKSNRIYFILLGFLHGSANLGGAVLNKYATWKIQKIEQRIPTIALVYIILMVFQILALWIANTWSFKLELNSFVLPTISLLTYLFLGKLLNVKNRKLSYSNNFFEYYSAFIGLMLILRYIVNL